MSAVQCAGAGLVTGQAAGHVALFATVLSTMQQHSQPDKNKHSLETTLMQEKRLQILPLTINLFIIFLKGMLFGKPYFYEL